MKSFADITKEKNHSVIDVLKMDIEGAEYGVIDSILETEIPIHQILIEFHDRYIKDGKNKTIKVIQTLKENGYEIFGVSRTFEEVSFIKKDLL
jgi:c-di-GMP-related signal transduction protein